MAWTGALERTYRSGDSLNLVIRYKDGLGSEYVQTISTTNTQASGWLENQISVKLKQLNDLDTYELSLSIPVESVLGVDDQGVLTVTQPDK